MRLALSDEQQMMVDALRQSLEQQAPLSAVREWLDADDPKPFARILVEGGWYAVGIPEEAGGAGGALPELALIAEELGRAAALTGPWLATAMAMPALAAEPLAAAVADGTRSVGWLVPAGRIPLASVATVQSGGSGVTAQVGDVLAGAQVDELLIPVEIDGAPAVIAVTVESAGVEVTKTALLDRARSLGAVSLDGASWRRVDLPDAAATIAAVRDRAAVLTAADALGAAQRMLEMTVRYTLDREQFGVRIASFQAVKHQAARMLVEIEPVRSVIRYAAWTVEAGAVDAPLHAAVAKVHATEAAVRVAESALMLHGAIGFTWEHDLQLLYKRAKLDRALFGPPANWRSRVADLLLPRSR